MQTDSITGENLTVIDLPQMKNAHGIFRKRAIYSSDLCRSGGRLIQIAWLRSENTGEVYTGAIGIPREISCRKKGEDYVLVKKL